ncbi:hypothetical protein O9G_004472 [Rozella allomycis CSF55]|uniref:Homeobox domain-containing protein n=1 Tax=Rozella allomycis (strain CSF55) TaxID=988480 RepID=A0A075B537_ROZAC|nr:hypothetical protein O9G_004472 [Rozella allomycis CSF55]|eukprot:EPZ36883.1 hypothetical protein O9G_004472 [Rozella allomycis CSF55]
MPKSKTANTRTRTSFSLEQKLDLQESFAKNHNLSRSEIQRLALKTNLEPKVPESKKSTEKDKAQI